MTQKLDRKHQLFAGLMKPLSSGYEKLNAQIEQLAIPREFASSP